MKRCLRCVIPDTRPDTAFVDGVCAACIAYARRPQIDWTARRAQLEQLLARARQYANDVGNQFDCIVPSSGGKDSHYQVLTLLAAGWRVLAVTATTCHLTALGRANIENLKRYVTTIEVTPPSQSRAKLNKAGLEMVGDISWPEHVSIFTTPFKMAIALGIPFLFYGENPQNQYGGPLEEQEATKMTARWVSEFGGFLGLRAQDLVGVDGLTESDMADYAQPNWERAQEIALEAHFLGQYVPWDSHANAELARKSGMAFHLPHAANLWEHENLDNAQTGIHDHFMYRKYGFGRGAAQASVDIRAGRMKREEALAFVETCDGLFPERYAGVNFTDMLSRIGMTQREFWNVADKFTNWALFNPRGDIDFGRPVVRGEQ
jgi:N-acetyl sugar amidotransferase